MPITNPLNNLVTGQPVKVSAPIQVNREPSRKGVQQSTVSTYSEFKTTSKQRSSPTVDELGTQAAKITRKGQPGPIVDILI